MRVYRWTIVYTDGDTVHFNRYQTDWAEANEHAAEFMNMNSAIESITVENG